MRFLRYQFPAFAWVATIYASSSLNAQFYASLGTSVDHPWAPKVVHVLFFFFLCFFLNRAFTNQRSSPRLAAWSLPMSILICVTFGVLDEVHQVFVAGRHPRLTDVLLDFSGATLMAIALLVRARIVSLRQQRVVASGEAQGSDFR